MAASRRIPGSHSLSQQTAERMLADAGLSPAEEDPVDELAAGAPTAGNPAAGYDTEPSPELADIYLDPFGALSADDEQHHETRDITGPTVLAEPVALSAAETPRRQPPRTDPGASTERRESRQTAVRPAPRSRRPEPGTARQPAEVWPNGTPGGPGSPVADAAPQAYSWVDDPEEFDDTNAPSGADTQPSAPASRAALRTGGERPGLRIAARLNEPWVGWLAIGAALMLAGVLAGLLIASKFYPQTPPRAQRATATAAPAGTPRLARAVAPRPSPQRARSPRRDRRGYASERVGTVALATSDGVSAAGGEFVS